MHIYQPLEAHGNELREPRLHQLAAAPGTPVEGQFFYDTVNKRAFIWNGTAWIDFGSIIDGTVTNAKLAADAVTQAKIADNAVGTAEIIDGAVTRAKHAANSVDASKIVDGSVGTAELAAGAVTAAKIGNGEITTTQIAAAAGILKSQLAALNIANADVAAGAAIARSKLDFGSGLVNADIAAAAAIAQSKLALSITNSEIAAGAAIALSKLATDPLARANHTGTQLAATISNFDTQVRTSRLDQMAAPTAAVAMNAQKITGLADPTAAQDAATKNYVDLMRQGIRLKDAVRVATTANVANLAGGAPNVVDGVNLAVNDRVLVKDQATAAQNGIYIVQTLGTGANGTWVRAADADTAAEVTDGTTTFIQEGTANNAKTFSQTNPIVTLGTDSQTWAIQGAAAAYLGGAGMVLNGSTFDIVAGDATIVVNADSIVAGVMQSANIADGSITSAKIADGTIVDADIAAGAAIAVSKVNGAVKKFAVNIGNAAATSFVINHNFGHSDVQVQVSDAASPGNVVYPDVDRATDANNCTVRFTGIVPANNQFRVIVQG